LIITQKQKEFGFLIGLPVAGAQPDTNRVLASFGCYVVTRVKTGKNQIYKTVQNPIHLWLKRRHQGTNA
jgi:hypothetical protein